MAIIENKNTPICLPTKSPNTIPRGTGDKRDSKLIPSRDTPAFASANNGIIPKATYELILCSILVNKEYSLFFFLCGITVARSTPDIVA